MNPSSDALIGTVVDQRYRIDREVGSGGFGTVFAGYHLTLDVPIAIKIFRVADELSIEQRATALTGFAEEARVLTRLRHDNVVRTLDQGLTAADASGQQLPYVVMEWCGEESLATFLRNRLGAPMSPEMGAALLDSIAAGVAHAHAEGVVHRDLKPANIMLSQSGNGVMVPRIIDFGIAKAFDAQLLPSQNETRTTGRTAFTPAYASPEQAVGARTGPWTDVHALGLILVELLTGKPPYGDEEGISLAIIDPVRPTPGVHGVDAGPLEPVIAKALSIRPQDRYADGGQFRQALKAAIETLALQPTVLVAPETKVIPGIATTARSPETGGRVRSAPLIAAAIGVPAVLVCSALAFGIYLRSSARASGVAGERTVASTSASAASAHEIEPEPPRSATPVDVRPSLAKVTVGDLVRRMERAGVQPISPPDPNGPTSEVMINFTKGAAMGALYLNELSETPNTPAGSDTLVALWAIRKWAASDGKQGFGLAYAAKNNWVLSMSWQPLPDDDALKTFDKIAEGLSFDVRGASWTRPDPATEVGASKPYWHTKSLGEVIDMELAFRIEAAGGSFTQRPDPGQLIFTVRRRGEQGEVRLFDTSGTGNPAAEQFLEGLRTKKTRFALAEEGTVHAVSLGAGSLATPEFLDAVLAGLPAKATAFP